ncbi:hypothetical protein I316_03171 [Kwoniella heveanensis BCC8398]|uniref:C3H1-type domain-containing protein n=1 Tax=Kwoniella heveanensis BCC8398 TaxID=1296120 RepID=A0A1B9GVR4_9TREE|nr:hypothetical protein I316_03171 [Kwoniella heveanensis BCC8398]
MKHPCRFIDTPQGCKKGADCGYSHDRSSVSASSKNGDDHRSRSQWTPSNNSHVMPPNGQCRIFYNEGSCPRGSDCKYAHDRTLPKNHTPPKPAPNLAVRIADFNGDSLRGNIDSNWRSGPFTRLIERLEEGDHLNNPTEAYTFVGGLVATTIEDSAWMHQDTQVYLAAVATIPSPSNRCLSQILSWPDIMTTGDTPFALNFQRGFIPLFLYLSSSAVINSPIKHYTAALYALLDSNVPHWAEKTLRCVRELVELRHLPSSGVGGSRVFKPTSFLQVFLPVTYVLCGYLASFQKALGQHGQLLSELVKELPALFDTWATDLLSTSPTFRDSIAALDIAGRRHVVSEAERVIQRLQPIVDRCQGRITQRPARILQVVDEMQKQQWRLDRLEQIYDPPGDIRPAGPRHDNDCSEIARIELLPAHEELLCSIPPFIPANIPSSPHHLVPATMERQIDILFRLLREDTVRPFQSAVKSLLFHLQGKRNPALSALLQRGGGRWRSEDSSDSTDLNIYADAKFHAVQLVKDELCVVLSLRTPKNAGSSSELRKKLGQGAMVGLLMRSLDSSGTDELKVFLGEVKQDVTWNAIRRSQVHVNFHSSEVFIAAIKFFGSSRSQAADQEASMVFFEVPGFLLGTLMPFLERLQTMDPWNVPFQQYIAGTTDSNLPIPHIDPPRFARDDKFVYNLDRLVSNPGGLRMRPSHPVQVKEAHETLLIHSPLDESQASALLDSMSREVAIVEGPPGTGKSFVGIKHVQVLIDSGISPIYVIAYTNHALDQFLEDIYTHVTHNIVRCGSRSKSDLIQSRSLHELSSNPTSTRSRLRHEIGREYSNRKEIEAELKHVCMIASWAGQSALPWEALEVYLLREFPDHYDSLTQVPRGVLSAHQKEREEGWQQWGRKSKAPAPDAHSFIWWRDGLDLDLLDRTQPKRVIRLENPHPVQEADLPDLPPYLRDIIDASANTASNDNVETSFEPDDSSDSEEDRPAHERQMATMKNWKRPSSDRHLETLREDANVWNYSAAERKRILAYWKDLILHSEVPKLARLRQIYKDINGRIRSLNNEKKLEILRQAKIIGCTTNGAANISTLISSAAPRVLIVEEAGECLEAHIVANLVPSIEQLILIGDHLQLRPQIGNYRLSIESKEGKNYRLDESLFERLVNAGLPYSVLQTQRRMRPEISDLIRNHLYPELVDHESVQHLPALKGLSRNVVFFDHNHAQDRQNADSSSKTNFFEAEMVSDLVMHFLNQGYQAGDIAVLTPYLGQVKVIKQALQNRRLVVELDDGDERDLARLSLSEEEDQEGISSASWTKTFENRSADTLVTLRSVDNFQGEEAKVVILSQTSINFNRLAIASIGFLKSANRTNVALSRAKQGMVILGNAGLFASQSSMWRSVLDTLEAQEAVFDHIPLRCELHPGHDFGKVQRPGVIPMVAPDGGCLAHCQVELRCGHTCPRLCHPADRQHNNVKCIEPCSVGLPCSGDPQRPHVCRALCGEPHVCDFVVASLQLPCGHEANEVSCAAAHNPSQINCTVVVERELACGHLIDLRCGEPADQISCNKVCGMILDCKHATCKARCGVCRPPSFYSQENARAVRHAYHRCEKQLTCGHLCTGYCQEDIATVGCAPCKMECERACDHASCQHTCGERQCRSCMKDCRWSCVHQGVCQNLCSMPCARLACDEPCDKLLDCGHSCPSVCGENCSKQTCPRCATDAQKSSVVDLFVMTTLAEVDISRPDLDCRLITLGCGHTFTVESLDGQFGLNRFYSSNGDKWTGLTNPHTEANGQQTSCIACPHCRAPILSNATRRYGRAWKHYDLLNQEQAAMTHGSGALSQLIEGQASMDVQAVVTQVNFLDFRSLSKPLAKRPLKAVVTQLELEFSSDDTILTPWKSISDLATVGITGPIANGWKKVISSLSPLFESARSVVDYKSPHAVAYEATHAKLYRSFKDLSMGVTFSEDFQDLRGSTITALALDYARRQIGSPFPRASSTFKVKAVLVTLKLRSDWLAICNAFISRISDYSSTEKRQANVDRFDIFVRHFIRCCIRDASACIAYASSNEAHNQMMLSWLHKVRFQLSLSRFDVESALRRAESTGSYSPNIVADRVETERQAAFKALSEAVRGYLNPPTGNVVIMRQREAWLKENFADARTYLLEEWVRVHRMAEEGTRFEEVTDEERRSIFNTMGIHAPGNGAATRW